MNITILGSGNIGGTLGKIWAAAGHKVRFGVRDMSAPKHGPLPDACGQNAAVVTAGEDITIGEVVLLAIPSATPHMAEALIADIGLLLVYLGALDKAPLLDAITRLFFALAIDQGHSRHLAFKTLGISSDLQK